MTMDKVEKLARFLCAQDRRDPDELEPGDVPQIDGRMRNGDPGHFRWREYVKQAKAIIKLLAE